MYVSQFHWRLYRKKVFDSIFSGALISLRFSNNNKKHLFSQFCKEQQHMMSSTSSSVVLIRKSSDAVGFALWMNKMTDTESQVNVVNVESVNLYGKTLEQGKVGQCESKKKLCMCAPTSHPGSFKCRYHRTESVQKMKAVQDPATAVARHFLKLGMNNKNTKPTTCGVKPQASRFSKAAAAVELPR